MTDAPYIAIVTVTFRTANERTGLNYSTFTFKSRSAAEGFALACLDDDNVLETSIEDN